MAGRLRFWHVDAGSRRHTCAQRPPRVRRRPKRLYRSPCEACDTRSVTLRPSAHGSLGKTPFAHLLLYLQGRKLSGTLAIWPDDRAEKRGQDRVLFEHGTLTAMRPIEPAKSLYAALIPLFGAHDAPYGFYEGQNLLGQGGALTEPIDLYTL